MSFRQEQRRRPSSRRRRDFPLTRGRVIALVSLVLVAAAVLIIVLGSVGGSSRKLAGSTAPATHPKTGGSSSNGPGRSESRGAAQGTASVPILVYHVINARPIGSSALSSIYVPADEFTSQMQALKANGWHAVTLNQVEAYWTRGVSLGTGKPIVITFDNGYASHYTNARPVLQQLGWVGVENLQVTGLPPSEGGLTDQQIRGLIAAGWELDTQGLSHAQLTNLDSAQLTDQVATARQTLRTRYGVPVNWFSYPLGDYDPTVLAAVHSAGYVGATTVNPGWASPQQDRFRLPRVAVVGGTSPSQLLAQIAAAKATTSVPSSFTGRGVA